MTILLSVLTLARKADLEESSPLISRIAEAEEMAEEKTFDDYVFDEEVDPVSLVCASYSTYFPKNDLSVCVARLAEWEAEKARTKGKWKMVYPSTRSCKKLQETKVREMVVIGILRIEQTVSTSG